MTHVTKSTESNNQDEGAVDELPKIPKANKAEITICCIISGVMVFWEGLGEAKIWVEATNVAELEAKVATAT